MSKTQNPSDMSLGLPASQLRWAQSLHKAVNGGLDMGQPTSKDSSGNYNAFQNPNMNGVLVRISPSGGIDNPNAWSTSNTAIKINHGLVDSNGSPRQPVGVHLVNSNKALSIYQPTTPDETYAYVAPSDATSYATLWIF